MKRVYFIKPIGMDGPIKIGCSNKPGNRLIALSAWSPFPLEIIGSVPGDFADEQFIHRCFLDLHSHREWFRSSGELRDAINKIIADGSLDELRKTASPLPANRKKTVRIPKSPNTLRRQSYGTRIEWAKRKLRDKDEAGAWYPPNDVTLIISRWQGRGKVVQQEPTDAEIARLDEYLADPAVHSVIPVWKRPRDPICIPVFVEATPDEMAPAASAPAPSRAVGASNLESAA